MFGLRASKDQQHSHGAVDPRSVFGDHLKLEDLFFFQPTGELLLRHVFLEPDSQRNQQTGSKNISSKKNVNVEVR